MSGYGLLIDQFNRENDIRRRQAQLRTSAVAQGLGALGDIGADAVTGVRDRAAWEEFTKSLGGGTTGTGAVADLDAPAEDDEPGAGPSLPPSPGMVPPPANPKMMAMADPEFAPSLPPMPGKMAPPPAPPMGAQRPMAKPPTAPPPMPPSRGGVNYGALGRMSPRMAQRAMGVLGADQRDAALASREGMAALRETGLNTRSDMLDRRARDIASMRDETTRYGTDVRSETARRGQDIGAETAGMRDATTRRGQDIGNENADAALAQRGDQFNRGLKFKETDLATRDENADADRALKERQGAQREARLADAAADLKRVNGLKVDLQKQITQARIAQMQGQPGQLERIAKAYAPVLTALESRLAKALAASDGEEEDPVVQALRKETEGFRRLLEDAMTPQASAPASGGGDEPTPEELEQMDAEGMRWDPERGVVPK